MAYVALPPGTVPDGAWATISRLGDAGSIVTAVRDGGFDPVPIAAQVSDFIDIRVTGGGTPLVLRVAVRAARPPVVVRTQPPRRKTDVALNAAIVIVFSEPVADGTLSPSSVQLFQGTTVIGGTVRLLQGTGAAAAFIPDALLNSNTDYSLVVTRAVRDLEGDALAAGVTVAFTTGQSSTGPAASITLSPDSVWMTGATYQMTATVRDEAGNMLVDQPVTWSTSDPSGLTVSQTGLLTGLATGYYLVRATLNELWAGAPVYVLGGPPASLTVLPTQATVGAGDTISVIATVRDAAGRLLPGPVMGWTSSDPSVATVQPDSVGRRAAFATVTGVNLGSATITGTSGTLSGTVSLTVVPPLPVASVTVTPNPASVLLQGTLQLSAAVRDANGKVLAGRVVTWTSDNPAVATVDANGVVTGVSLGSAGVTATSEGLSDTASITVQLAGLAFVSTRDERFNIYMMTADGTSQGRLTDSNSVHSPAWSPDGQKIAFVFLSGVYVMNAGGGAWTLLGPVGNNVHLAGSAWSPDGQKIVFSDDRYGDQEIVVANADGSGVSRPREDPGRDVDPMWSPDGQKIAFTCSGEICVMNADGSAVTRLTNGTAADNRYPAWSPDGQKIAFASGRAGEPNEIYVMNVDGSAVTRLTNNVAWDYDPAWSPDGQKIMFWSTRDGNADIYVMNADGTALRRLTDNTAWDYDPVWSPDGQKIAFVSERDGQPFAAELNKEIYVMNADGSAQTNLTRNPAWDIQPRWRP